MLILILGIAVLALVTFSVLTVRYANRDSKYEGTIYDLFFVFFVMSGMSGLLCVSLIIAICCSITEVATANILDEKIAMYQEENTAIEQDIDKIVKEYLAHEHDTFADLKTEESSITLVTLFPELKSDTLVQQQLEIYVANNAKIKSLKEEKINIAKTKWILYFGR